MEHLTTEELARLVDEDASDLEAEHLGSCVACANELHEMREQTIALRGLVDPTLPIGLRSRVEDALAEEGLIATRRVTWGGHWSAGLRIAAGFALFLLGSATGAFLLTPESGSSSPIAAGGAPVGVEEAAAALRSAEAEYLRAVMQYAEVAESGQMLDPLNRLVALEGIVLTTEAALREAPADPIINNFHLTAVGQREALLRQIDLATDGDEWF